MELIDSIRHEASENLEYGFDDDWKTFMKKMRVLTAQASGARIQNYLIRKYGWIKVSSNANRGDAKDSSDRYFEVKITIITTSNPLANIVQIRPWQKVTGHHIFVIDSINNYELTHFFLTEHEMQEEVNSCGQSAHGTRDADKDNKNKEWAIHMNWEGRDDTRSRWIKKYKRLD